MKFPTLNICDLINNNEQQKIIVHDLKELIENDFYISKKPHRHSFYHILYIEKGNGVHTIDFIDHEIENEMIFFVSPGQVHNLEFFDNNSSGAMINFSEDLFSTFLANNQLIDNFAFFNRSGKVSKLNVSNNLNKIKPLIKDLKTEKRIEILRLHLLELLYESNEIVSRLLNTSSQESYSEKLFKFELLIEDNFIREHYPKFYAEKLSITPNYLTKLCSDIRGKTAGELIRERIVLEAKRLLVNSQLDISEISFQLGFEDNSYFTKFFKTSEKLTPKQFRKNL